MKYALALAALLSAAPAAAQFTPPNAQTFCATEHCFALGWSSTDEVFSLYLQNQSAGFSSIRDIRVERVNLGSEVLGIQEWDGARTIGNVEQGPFGTFGQNSSAQIDAAPYNSRNWFSDSQGLIGCTYSVGDPEAFAVRTCPALGLTGWFVMDLRLQILHAPTFDPDALTEFVRGATLGDFRLSVGDGDTACDITGANSGLALRAQECRVALATTVTPEPATLVLLASGVGVLALVRRRKAIA